MRLLVCWWAYRSEAGNVNNVGDLDEEYSSFQKKVWPCEKGVLRLGRPGQSPETLPRSASSPETKCGRKR